MTFAMVALRLVCLILLSSTLALPALRAGVARTRITPPTPAWLVGFAARTRPATEIGLDLYAKALALDAGAGRRAVIVTADLIGFTERVTTEVARRVETKHQLRRDQLFFYASHTHSGPAVLDRMTITVADSPEFHKAVEDYTKFLTDQVEAIIDQALGKLEPAVISSGWASANFAYNRRTEQLAQIRPGQKFPEPVDTRVPVLRVNTAIGQTIAYLFGYACHPTTLTGDTYEISGDYPGYAQRTIEAAQPGATALFVLLPAGDQRARPRGTRKLAEEHGRSLATAVLQAKLTPLGPGLSTSLEAAQLPFTAHTRDVYAAEAASKDVFAARRGKTMMDAMDGKTIASAAPYPVQALRLGTLILLAMPGEVVVDYALAIRAKYGNTVIPGAYASYLPGYIPSLRVQREGGYEAGDAMMYFNQPGWFTDQVESIVLKAVDAAIRKAR